MPKSVWRWCCMWRASPSHSRRGAGGRRADSVAPDRRRTFFARTALSAAVAGQAGALAIANAQPLAKNGHKVPMTTRYVERALMRLVRHVGSYNERRRPCVQ